MAWIFALCESQYDHNLIIDMISIGKSKKKELDKNYNFSHMRCFSPVVRLFLAH
jgi:hypothetical protein